MSAHELQQAVRHSYSALNPGGTILMGFFDAAQHQQFDHAVTPAYFWPVAELNNLLEAEGFFCVRQIQRKDPGNRAHGAIIARRGKEFPRRAWH